MRLITDQKINRRKKNSEKLKFKMNQDNSARPPPPSPTSLCSQRLPLLNPLPALSNLSPHNHKCRLQSLLKNMIKISTTNPFSHRSRRSTSQIHRLPPLLLRRTDQSQSKSLSHPKKSTPLPWSNKETVNLILANLKLRKRFKAEKQRPNPRAWEFFDFMDSLEKVPLPISARPVENYSADEGNGDDEIYEAFCNRNQSKADEEDEEEDIAEKKEGNKASWALAGEVRTFADRFNKWRIRRLR